MDSEQIRKELPEEARKKFDDILYSRVLGASRQTELICDMFIDIAHDENNGNNTIVTKINKTAQYYKSTRGQNSRAIYNAVDILDNKIKKIDSDSTDTSEYRNMIVDTVNSYKSSLAADTEKAAGYAAKLAQNMKSIMVFDYSSTVNSFIKQLSEKKIIYIPESRALNGGKPFLKDAVACGHDVHFIPDTAMLEALKKCDAAFMGAETLLPDGSVFNTIGSDILAVICKDQNIPLYAVSPLIKIDTRSIYGYSRLAPMTFDYTSRLASGWKEEEKEGIDFSGIKLIKVSGQYITAVCSEKGIIPSSNLFDIALKQDID